MKRVLIESPYAGVTGSVEENVRYARRCVRDCLGRGESPYASHLFFTQPDVLDDAIPEQRKQGIEAGFAWGETAHLVAVYIDRGVSEGMKKGIARAHAAKQPVVLRMIDNTTVLTQEHLDLLAGGTPETSETMTDYDSCDWCDREATSYNTGDQYCDSDECSALFRKDAPKKSRSRGVE